MVKQKIFEIEVPIEGEIKVLKTDLVCNSCGKQLQDGEYLYFCAKCEDDLCSSYICLKKHAGHRFFRWGQIETLTPIEELIKNRPAPPKKGDPAPPIKISTLGPPIGVPKAPLGALPPPIKDEPSKGPYIRTGALSALRTEMLKELKCLMAKKDDKE